MYTSRMYATMKLHKTVNRTMAAIHLQPIDGLNVDHHSLNSLFVHGTSSSMATKEVNM